MIGFWRTRVSRENSGVGERYHQQKRTATCSEVLLPSKADASGAGREAPVENQYIGERERERGKASRRGTMERQSKSKGAGDK